MIITTNKRAHRHEINWMEKDWIITDNKSNLNHNSTKKKEGYKKQRELIFMNYEIEYEDYLWCLRFHDDNY